MKKLFVASALAAGLAIAAPASAATIFSSGSLGPAQAYPSSFSFSTPLPSATSGLLSFTLNGFNTVDGTNAWQDDFSVLVNTISALKLSYDLGGGGGDSILSNPSGATVTRTGTGTLNISVPLTLLSGWNTFEFLYETPGPNNGGGSQGIGDESFSISDVTLSTVSAAPEPGTWVMMILGFGMAGAALRRRKGITTRVSFA